MARQRKYPGYSQEVEEVTLAGRLGNLGSSFVCSGFDGGSWAFQQEGRYKLTLNETYRDLLFADAEVLYPATQSGTVYGAAFETNSSVDQGQKDLYLNVWQTAFGYRADPAGIEVAVRLVLRKKGSRNASTS